MAVEVNPITQVHRALWTILELRADLKALVVPGARIKLTDVFRIIARKSAARRGVLPSLRLSRYSARAVFDDTSSDSKLLVRWKFEIATGDMVDDDLALTEFLVFRALQNWKTTLRALNWKSKQFVVGLRLLDGQETDRDAGANQGKRGWSAIWTAETHLRFTPANLKEVE